MKKKLIFATLLFITYSVPHRAQVVINELMQSNIDCIMDDLNEFPDSWVELYNQGTASVNLSNYRLGISNKYSEAWQLPSKTLKAGQHILVFCDKQATGLHTSFRLESGKGCEVYLFDGTTIADQVTGLKKQPAPNISYGRKTDGSNDWGYQLQPTPEQSNAGAICDRDHILGEPQFSQQGLVRSAPGAASESNINLELSMPKDTPEGTTIRYTLDGSEPKATTGYEYVGPITIQSTKVVKARLFCDGWLSPRSTCHSYIFFPTHSRPMTLPVISIVIDNRYLNDSKIGIFANNQENYLKNNWRRPMNIEYFPTFQAGSALNQLCETRITGNGTRGSAKKSMAIYAHKRFGTKRFQYEFFPDQKPGLTDFKSLVMRNAGNDFDYLYMRDAIIQRSMGQHCDLDWQAWQPAIVYINGKYHAILNIRERGNENNIYTNYDGLEDVDLIENDELKEGTAEHYKAFKTFYSQAGHTLEEYAKWMDWEEYINLMIMNLYYNNQDFPGNNNVMWRPRTEDGRWRWIAKDTDFGLGLYDSPANYQTFAWLYDPNYDWDRAWANQYEHTLLFRRLMENADFKRAFIDRCCIYMGDFLNEQGIRKVWDPMYESIKTEYPFHRNLINQWWPNYENELTKARNWLAQRTKEFYSQLGNFYKQGKPISLTINPESIAIDITFNDIKLSTGTFNGNFFANRNITLNGQVPEGKELKGWAVTGATNKEITGTHLTMQMPTTSITIRPIVRDATGIDNISVDNESTIQAIFNQQGVRLQSLEPGLNIVVYADGSTKKVWIKK